MLIIPFLLLLLFFGLLVTILLKVKAGLAERLSLSYLLGIGLFTFFVFVFDLLLNINYSINNTFSLLISLCAILFVIKYKDTIEFFKNIKFEKKPFKWQSILFWSFIGLVIVYTLVVNLYWPVYDWDALALYDFRAKVFLIDNNFIHAAMSNGYFVQYPLLTSLSHLFVYQIGLQSPKIIYSFIYLAFILIFYSTLKERIGENKSRFLAVIALLIPEIFSHSMMAYTNLSYSVFLCTGIIYLYKWLNNNEISLLMLSSILIGLSMWVRNYEPFWVIALLAVILVSIKKKLYKQIIYYLLPLLVFNLSWQYLMSYFNNIAPPISTETASVYYKIITSISVERIITVLTFTHRFVFSSWGLIFLLIVITTVKSLIEKKSERSFLIIVISMILILCAGVFTFSVTYENWQLIPDSARRMSIFLIPLIVYALALGTSSKNKK